jgi:hypothetical protein
MSKYFDIQYAYGTYQKDKTLKLIAGNVLIFGIAYPHK